MHHFALLLLLGITLYSPPGIAKILHSDWNLKTDYERLFYCSGKMIPFYGHHYVTTQDVGDTVYAPVDDTINLYCSSELYESLKKKLNVFAARKQKEGKTRHKPALDLMNRADAAYHFISSGDSRFPANNRGSIDATVNSFREFQQGKIPGTGHSLSFSFDNELLWGNQTLFLKPYMDLHVTPQLDDFRDYRVTIHEGYGLFYIKPLSVFLGRGVLALGQGQYGGLIFSENGRPLDYLLVTHKNPITFPSILHYLGKWRFKLLFANLGPERTFPWSFVTGPVISWRPHQKIELNLIHVFEFGGDGSQDLSPVEGMREFLSFIPSVGISEGGSNKITEANFRLLFPRFMGLQAYLAYAADDGNLFQGVNALKKHLLHNSSYQVGAYFLCFLGSCINDVRIEGTFTGHIAYRHGEFLTGWTLNQNIMGDPLGPDASRLLLAWGHPWSDKTKSELNFKWQDRDSNFYTVSPDGTRASVAADGPAEKRMTWYLRQYLYLRSFQLTLQTGYEFIENYQFVNSNNKNSFFEGVTLSKDF